MASLGFVGKFSDLVSTKNLLYILYAQSRAPHRVEGCAAILPQPTRFDPLMVVL